MNPDGGVAKNGIQLQPRIAGNDGYFGLIGQDKSLNFDSKKQEKGENEEVNFIHEYFLR
jgi:hypothetical protein